MSTDLREHFVGYDGPWYICYWKRRGKFKSGESQGTDSGIGIYMRVMRLGRVYKERV